MTDIASATRSDHHHSLDECLPPLVTSGNWPAVLELADHFDRCELSRYLWAWPTALGLRQLGAALRVQGCSNVLSIGCGAGLLEWLLQQAADINVSGLELDQSWWTSAYSPSIPLLPRTFITATATISSSLLRQAAPITAADDPFALLFCYFNNGDAFDAYIRAFSGRLVVIVGPHSDAGHIVTEPNPWRVEFVTSGWRCAGSVALDANGTNVAVLYSRDETCIL